MPTSDRAANNLIPAKVRKRGSSPAASSSSSIIQNYRFKRAILIGKRGGSSTPLPTWRLINTSRSPSIARGAAESPKHWVSQSVNGTVPVPLSARKLAATFWEMNEIPSPTVKRELEERGSKRVGRGMERNSRRSGHSGPLPPPLSDPSHSPPVSVVERSRTSSHQRRSSPFSQGLKIVETMGRSFCNDGLMETGSRSQAQTPCGPTLGAKTRLKDVSNALTTSKELIKIMNRMWSHEDSTSSSMSIVSALHAELERARLLVNRVIKEQQTEEKEVDYLMKCFAEERTKWKHKERKAVEAAVESVVSELEVEKKLRTRLESLNKRLGRELAETRAALLEAEKELKTEKRSREIIEDLCDQLAGNVGEERVDMEFLESESSQPHEEVKRQRDSKVSTLEEEDVIVNKLRGDLEASFSAIKVEENGLCALNYSGDEDDVNYSSNTRPRQKRGGHVGEVEDMVECKDDSAKSEVDSVHRGGVGHHKACNETYPSNKEEKKDRSSISKKGRKSSSSLQRNVSDAVDYGIKSLRSMDASNVLDWERFQEQGDRDDMHAYNLVKGLRDRMLYGPGAASPRSFGSPSRQGHRYSLSSLPNTMQERPLLARGIEGKSRLATAKSSYYSSGKVVR